MVSRAVRARRIGSTALATYPYVSTGVDLQVWRVPGGERTTLVRPNEVYGAIGGASWDPTGTRVVAVVGRGAPGFLSTALVTVSENGGALTAVAGADNASSPMWIDEGILYFRLIPPPDQHSIDDDPQLRIISPSGGQPRTVYRTNFAWATARVVGP